MLGRDNNLIISKIDAEIALEPSIKGRIDVGIWQGKIRLSGVVHTLEEKQLAEDIARQISEFEAVESDITIETDGVPTEVDLAKLIRTVLATDPSLAGRVGAKRISKGVVILGGNVDSRAMEERVLEIVSEIKGIKRAISHLKIGLGKDTRDVTITNAVELALHEDKDVHAEFIGAPCKDRVVTLKGWVPSPRQKEKAERIASGVFGVRGVKNLLAVGTIPSSEDEVLEKKIWSALGKKGHLNLIDVKITVIDGIAFLDGLVDNVEQRDAIGQIARTIPAIKEVNNNLVVASR